MILFSIAFVAKIAARNYKQVRRMRHKAMAGEYIHCYDKGKVYVVNA